MGDKDRLANEVERTAGRVKEKAGEWTGNEDLEAQGRGDQSKADLKDAGESVKDAAGKVKDAVTE